MEGHVGEQPQAECQSPRQGLTCKVDITADITGLVQEGYITANEQRTRELGESCSSLGSEQRVHTGGVDAAGGDAVFLLPPHGVAVPRPRA